MSEIFGWLVIIVIWGLIKVLFGKKSNQNNRRSADVSTRLGRPDAEKADEQDHAVPKPLLSHRGTNAEGPLPSSPLFNSAPARQLSGGMKDLFDEIMMTNQDNISLETERQAEKDSAEFESQDEDAQDKQPDFRKQASLNAEQQLTQSIAAAFPQAVKAVQSASRTHKRPPIYVNMRGRLNVSRGIVMSEVLARPRAFDL